MEALGEGFIGDMPAGIQLKVSERQLPEGVLAAVTADLQGLSQEGCPSFGSCEGLARELGGISALGSEMLHPLPENCVGCITVNSGQNPPQIGGHYAA